MNWLLVCIIAIIIINALVGLKVGFIKTVFSMFSLLIAIILTVWASPIISNMLAENEKFNNMVTERIEKILPVAENNLERTEEETYIKKLSIPGAIKESLIENLDDKKEGINQYVLNGLIDTVIRALAFIITFIVIFILLWIVSFALNIISKLPVLNQINKLTGLLAGFLHGLIIVWLILVLLTVFSGTKFGQEAFVMIEESKLLSFIYNNNLLLNFITGAVKTL